MKGYPGFEPRNQGFFGKHFRKISTSLPLNYGDKEKLGRGRSNNKVMRLLNSIGWIFLRLWKKGALLACLVVLGVFYMSNTGRSSTVLLSSNWN